jgi:drug/metabolite transporter (DMT)-like permease
VVLAYPLAPASLLAPISYTQLLWVAIGGHFVFNNLPDIWTLVGATAIIANGMYPAHRERVRARHPRRAIP